MEVGEWKRPWTEAFLDDDMFVVDVVDVENDLHFEAAAN